MDLNEWSFALSVIGLALGLVSAYPQLRSATRRVLKVGEDGANRFVKRFYAQADFFIAYPSALVAYIAKSAFILAFMLLITVEYLRPGSPNQFPLPSWLQMALSLGITFAVGKIGGDLLNTVRVVVRRARTLHDQQLGSG